MNRRQFHSWLRDPHRTPLVAGVLNLTPDSFSDGGKYPDASTAVAHVQRMVEDGADWIDLGAESTRPGAEPVAPDEQIRRLEPVLSQVVGPLRDRVIFSIDTTRAAVAEASIARGVDVINDVSAGRDDPDMFALASRTGTPMVLMHMLGRPRDMQHNPHYDDVVGEVIEFLRQRLTAAESAGINPDRLLIDPGIGFGKTTGHNLQLLNRLDEIAAIGRPVLVGTSRKRFIGQITGIDEPLRRTWGTAATVAWSIARGASVVRVHDVPEMRQVLSMTLAMMHPPRA